MLFSFDIKENVIKIHYHENIEFFCQDLIDVALESGRYIDQSKNHHLALEMAIAGHEGCFSFIIFSDLYPMISIGQIELGETLSPT